jgi:glucose uptake protein
MYTPQTYPVALGLMLVSMLCWGNWANTQKIDTAWRFELFYWDYMWGIVACALLFGGTKGMVLSLLCGVVIGLFYPFVAKALIGPNHLGPYTVYFVFSLGALASNVPLNYAFMRRPVSGSRLSIRDYLHGGLAAHAWGVLGGVIWGTGTIRSFVAASTPMVGPATSFSLGEGNTMISAAWGVFVWKEFRGASSQVRRLLVLMFTLFVLGLVSISFAPLFG